MLMIFLASSQPAEESGELSGGLTDFIFGNIWRFFSHDGQDMPEPFFVTLETILRKGAHLVVFFILGFCAANAIRYLTTNRRRVFWVSFLWGSAYGALDEFHQTFVPGRAGMWQDWLLDTVGALLGVLVVLRFIWIKQKGTPKSLS
ncbi:MAG: VanZ family protein [Oscillospiraceae bacterium]|nr:VanZ family protein [Oscillospiraceae bacterium]